MCIKKCCIMLIIILFDVFSVLSQEHRTEMCVNFRVNRTEIDSLYLDNAESMREIVDFLVDINQDTTIKILEVSFCGAASPEGSYQLNKKLARGRLESLEKFVRSEVDIPDSIITRTDSYIPWDYLKKQIEVSDIKLKEEVLAIIDEEAKLVDYHLPKKQIDNRIVKLQRLDGGRVWKQLNRQFFKRMRNACAIFVTYKRELPKPQPKPEILSDSKCVSTDCCPAMDLPSISLMPLFVMKDSWPRRLYLKTNVIEWGLAIANVGVEVDLTKHLSFSLPVSYSAWNYFKSTIKFRTFKLQPEIRYWLSEQNDGLFVGAHFGMAYYNFAVDGDYRYQDHEGKTPALGGGVSIGYRMPISADRRWRVEFSLGAGGYSLNYDKFHNTPRTKDGLMVEESIKKTYWGIDRLSVTFSYTIDLKKGGGL